MPLIQDKVDFCAQITIYRQSDARDSEAERERCSCSSACREHGMSISQFYKWRAKFVWHGWTVDEAS